jgi:CRP/FNR family transcriptional regulator
MDNNEARTATVRRLQPLDSLKAACATCNLRELCVPGGIPAAELVKLDALVAMRKRVKRGETLFNAGDEFRSLFAVRTGFFKTRITSNDGRDQITGFQVPGELLGFDGVATEQHGVDAIALEDSDVCILPYAELERIARDFQPLQHQLHRVMSREIVRENNVMLLLGTMKAEERVAAFLLNLSERYRHLGYAASEFVLRMTRQEIGSYLGLKLETVSRSFSKFQEQGIIEAQGKHIKLLDMDALRHMISASKP